MHGASFTVKADSVVGLIDFEAQESTNEHANEITHVVMASSGPCCINSARLTLKNCTPAISCGIGQIVLHLWPPITVN